MPSLDLASEPAAPSLGLRALDGWLVGVAEETAERIRLAAGEAISNAVEHGSARSVTVRWTPTATGGTLCVSGARALGARQLETAELPSDRLATGGRGLYILTRLVDRLDLYEDILCMTFEPRETR